MAKGRRTEGTFPAQAENIRKLADTVIKFALGDNAGLDVTVKGTMGKFVAYKGDTVLAENVTSDSIYGVMQTLFQAGERIGVLSCENGEEEVEEEKPEPMAKPKKSKAA